MTAEKTKRLTFCILFMSRDHGVVDMIDGQSIPGILETLELPIDVWCSGCPAVRDFQSRDVSMEGNLCPAIGIIDLVSLLQVGEELGIEFFPPCPIILGFREMPIPGMLGLTSRWCLCGGNRRLRRAL